MADRRSRAASPIVGLVLALVMLAGMAGCGNGVEDTTDTADTASDGTTTESDAGSSGSTNDLASGSGCTPGTETGLPDGRWYGSIEAIDGRRVEFDLACWFTGAAAEAAAAEDGAESPPPNDYYVRNVNPLVRTLDVADGTMVEWYPDFDPLLAETVSFDQWSAVGVALQLDNRGFWIETGDGLITAIEEEWVA